MIKFSLTACVLASVFWCCLYGGIQLEWWSSMPSYWFETIAVQLVGVILVYFYLSRVSGQPQVFANRYIFTIVLKLIVFGTLILGIIYLDSQEASANGLLFIVSYIGFTALEVSVLFREIRSN